MKTIKIGVLILLLFSCSDGEKGTSEELPSAPETIAPKENAPEPPSSQAPSPIPSEAINSDILKISSFNIQILGDSKVKKVEVMKTISKIINLYDVVMIQELRDSDGSSVTSFMNIINQQCQCYSYEVSPRLGRSSSKEQYFIVYNKNKITAVSSLLYPDIADKFEREPFAVNMTLLNNSSLTLVSTHIKPEDAYNEIHLLSESYNYFEQQFPLSSLLIAGDFNADCSYLSKSDKSSLEVFSSPYYSPITADTTVAKSSCSYDKFIYQNNDHFLDAGVFYYNSEWGLNQGESEAISDHYPIFINYKL